MLDAEKINNKIEAIEKVVKQLEPEEQWDLWKNRERLLKNQKSAFKRRFVFNSKQEEKDDNNDRDKFDRRLSFLIFSIPTFHK